MFVQVKIDVHCRATEHWQKVLQYLGVPYRVQKEKG